ncbi:MAG TPA: hypothetical protein P5076_17580, partial [Myxococcota bacterium]|nr:hypothetical protein [Myxococcota bacterium]
ELGPDELPRLREIGRAVVLLAEEGRPPALWFGLLDRLLELLLGVTRAALEREAGYDGRWDAQAEAGELARSLGLLAPVRAARLDEDRAWLGGLESAWRAGRRSSTEVFMDLLEYERPAARAAAWEAWLRAVLPAAGPAPAPTARALLQAGLTDWLARTRDRGHLLRLARGLRGLAAAGGPQAGGVAGVLGARLAEEAGRGALEPVHEALRSAAAAWLEAEGPGALAQALALRSGPVAGLPLSLADVRWRLGLLEARPGWARALVLDTLAAFGLERVRLPEAGAGAAELAELLAALLGRGWPEPLRFPLRALVRLAPLPPLQLSGPTTRATLLALAPAGPSYLGDLRERVLDAPGPDNLVDAERVLEFWRSGEPQALGGLASPDALATLTLTVPRDADIRSLLEGLAQHAPGADKRGVRWLAHLPATFHEVETLRKLAGFAGLHAEAVQTLACMLRLHRALAERYAARRPRAARADARPVDELLARADELLGRSGAAPGRLMGDEAGACFEGLPAFGRLERFADELRLGAELELVLEQLARRVPPEGPAGREVLLRMLRYARASGHALDGLQARLEGAAGLTAALRGAAGEESAALRAGLLAELGPYVLGSCRRLLENPLAEPTPDYRQALEAARGAGLARVAEVLGAHLVDELLGADGGLQSLMRYVRG